MGAVSDSVGVIELIQTAKDTGDRLAAKEKLSFGSSTEADAVPVKVDPAKTYQQMEGFGGAFTEAGASTLSKLSQDKRAEVLNAYFHAETGSRYSLCRTHINSCDFSLGNYSYCDVEGDYDLRQFDISHDRELLIPFIKDAMKISGNGFKLFASPWSPPAWMKTNGEMNNGGQLKKDCLATWALYFCKYIKAYAKEGVDIWGITVQNEPDATQTWDSCRYTEEEERDFIKFYLGPRLAADALARVKIICWDHNKDDIVRRVATIVSDPDAAKYVWGIGFHWYTGDFFENLAKVHERFPDKRLLFTEGCQEQGVKLGSWDLGEKYGHAMIGDFNNWTVGWVDWNMVLDQHGGPNHVGNFCDAPIIADTEKNVVHYQSAYYYIAHFSRYVVPGAYRIAVKSADPELEVTAFKNPDGSIVAVLMNATDEPKTYALKQGDRQVSTSIPARAIQTLLYTA